MKIHKNGPIVLSVLILFMLMGCGGGGGSGTSEKSQPSVSQENPAENLAIAPTPPDEPVPDVIVEEEVTEERTDEETGEEGENPSSQVIPRTSIYVAKDNPNASDDNEGTIDAPLSTVEAAFEKANQFPNPVTLFVSAESYTVQRSLTMDRIIAIEGGYLPDFSATGEQKTELLFEGVIDDVLIHLKSDPSGGLNVPLQSFKNLVIRASGRTDYYYSIASSREGLSLFRNFSLIDCEVYGNIFLGRDLLDSIEIRDNLIFGSDGGRSGGASPNNRYNLVIEGVVLSPLTHIRNNLISGGELVGSYDVRWQSLIYFPPAGITYQYAMDFDIAIEGNRFVCGRVQICQGIHMDNEMKVLEEVVPIFIRQNIFSGGEDAENINFVAFSSGTRWGHVEFVENEIYFPNVEYLTGVSVWSPLINEEDPYYRIEGNLFALDAGAERNRSIAGVGLSDVVGTIEILNNRFDLPAEAVEASRYIFSNGNPEDAVTINSDVEVVIRRF